MAKKNETKITIEWAEEIAKKTLKETGKHQPQVIIEQNGKVELFVLLFDDDKKEEMLRGIRTMIAERNITRYLFITEAWAIKRKVTDSLLTKTAMLPPSKHPDRTEMLLISEYVKDGTGKMIVQDFSRDENGDIVWGERNEMDNKENQMVSRWNFFIEDALEEHIQMDRLREFEKTEDFGKFEEFIDDFIDKKMGGEIPFDMSREDFKKKMIDTAKNMVKEGKIIKRED